MKKMIIVGFLSILFLILDNTLMPFLNIKGVYPSLLLVFAMCYSIINGSWSGIAIGIFSGALQDVYLIGAFGINMLLNMLMCLIASKIGEAIFKDKSSIPIITCFVLSLLKGVLMFVILYILKIHFNVKIIFLNSIYNAVVAVFMYKRIYKLCQRKFMVKNWKF
ncbi:rod shape-determining protein MreD [Clostridium aestuarii]|uniref:Rod shape-determining protein MreD n=1 Tax=Clostridium aestuarii TaxID=338193 RepID=A0ABT4D4A3_9CLOT|nr:rod shape-determining protein MreD [Clostridium aestuarii]MCY6485075.1 rod shape-determining protein MreD [Clostridium aestuarii]